MASGELPASVSVPGKVPSPRFANYNEVVSLCYQMVQDDQRRAIWRARIDSIWGGNPTYREDVLKAANQGWRARVNYREMEGIVSSEQTLDYDLETEVDNIIDIDLDYGKGQEQRDWQECIEKEFSWLILDKWDDRNFHAPYRIFNKLLHGMGAHIWPDVSGKWIPRTPRPGSLLFPDDAPFNFSEDGEYFMLRDWVPGNVLYRRIANEKQARDIGWNPDAVWKALALSGKQNVNAQSTGTKPEEVQRLIRDGDIGYSATRQSGVWLNHCFVKEYETGKISHYIVAEKVDAGAYLFEKRNRFDDWPMVMFPYDIGNGTIHSVRGLGARTKDFFELSNRIKNSMADQVQLGAYPHFKQLQAGLDPDKLKLMRAGAMTISPYGLEEVISKYPQLDNGPLALSRELRQTMLQNNRGGMGGQQPEQMDRMTAEEYAMRQRDATKLNNGSVALQKSNLRRFYETMLRKALEPSSSNEPWAKMAKEFRDRCVRNGVPTEAFKHIVEVRAVVNWGKGSASAQIHGLMTLMQTIYPVTTEDRKIAIERDLTAAVAGYTNVDRYARSVNDQDMPDNDDSFIVLEDDALSQGKNCLAAPKQNHVKHVQSHLAQGAQMYQAVLDGHMDPQQAYAAIHAIGQHCGETQLPNGGVQHGHLFYLQSNPILKPQFVQLFNQWQSLSRIADKLASDIKSAAEATPPQQQISEKMQIGLAGVQADVQVKMAKVQADQARKQQELQFKQRMEAVKTTTALLHQRAKTGSEITNARAKTASDIQLNAADTVASIASEQAKTKAKLNGTK